MSATQRLWWVLGSLFVLSFGALLLIGAQIYQQAPPVPARLVSSSGELLYTRADIDRGRLVWQSIGGHMLGSIWGHGSYVAPDWTADWLHREAVGLLDARAQAQHDQPYARLSAPQQAALRAELQARIRPNGYDAKTDTITVDAERAAVIRAVANYYQQLFGSDAPAFAAEREQMAIANGALPDAESRRQLAAFFWWTAWAAVTERPGDTISYTSNWPYEPLVANTPSTAMAMWSVASVVLLLAGIGGLVWHHARSREEAPPQPPKRDPFAGLRHTASMLATRKYFYTVVAMFLLQMTLGGITAHYAVEGHAFYGIPLSDWLPYAVTRSWHTQLAVFWIATAWLATGLYIAPALSGHEPKYQALGVNVLYGALVLVVGGALAGQWLGVQQVFDVDTNFWLGHQGWEFVDIGRLWQIALFGGLLLWLLLMGRALWPALQKGAENRTLVTLVFLSTVAIALFYGAGLAWGKHTHISVIEYWRWWVVHLWVEGFFEVFATAVIALIFVKLGLVSAKSGNQATLFATVVFLFGGILGTLHHLYFVGGATHSVIAVGAMFSALEVVPLVLLGIEAYHTYRTVHAAPWVDTWRWPILFFVAVAFWNLVGAGLFGFLINPPVVLYYVQGLNLTANHGHAALFGVYGMLGIGLMLFCLRGLSARFSWSDGALRATFWLLNGGLALMVLGSLLPSGIYQTWQVLEHGFWYARSPAVIHSPVMETLVWLRVPGDIVFALGVLALVGFILRLRRADAVEPVPAGTAEAEGEA